MQNNRSAKDNNRLVRGLVAGFVSASISLVALGLIYNQAMSSKVLYGTKLGSFSIGGLQRNEVDQFLNQESKFILNSKLDVNGKEVALADLDISIDENKVLAEVLDYKDDSLLHEQVLGDLKTLVTGRQINWPLIASSETRDLLGELVSDVVKDSIDAKLVLNDGEVDIQDGQSGLIVDVEGTLALLSQRMIEEQPTSFEVLLVEVEPVIKKMDLTLALNQARDVAREQLELTFYNQGFVVERKDLIEWLAPIKNQNGTYGLAYNESNIRESLSNIAQQINKEAKATEISTIDGSIISNGKNGYELDIDLALEDITEALSLRVGSKELISSIELAVLPIEAPTKKVQPRVYSNSGTAGLYEGKYIEVDLSSQVLYQYDGETLVGHHIVSTGAWGTPTPIGTYSINSKHPRAYSSTYGLYMPYWMAFIGSTYGFHELPEWPNGYKEGQDHLGTPVSHGCVRLGEGSAASLYSWADVGTPIVIHN